MGRKYTEFYEEPYYKINDIVTVQQISQKHKGLLSTVESPPDGEQWQIKSVESKSSIYSDKHTYNLESTKTNQKLEGVVQCRLCYDLKEGIGKSKE